MCFLEDFLHHLDLGLQFVAASLSILNSSLEFHLISFHPLSLSIQHSRPSQKKGKTKIRNKEGLVVHVRSTMCHESSRAQPKFGRE